MNSVLLKSFRHVDSPLEKCLFVADPFPPIGQRALTPGLWLADHDPSARPGHWCQVMAPRIIPAQRRLGVKTVPDNQRIIKPQCDTIESDNKLHLVMLTLTFCRPGCPPLVPGVRGTLGCHRYSVMSVRVNWTGIFWARCFGFYGGCVFANPASGWTFPATKYWKHNLVHYNLMIFLTEQRFGCRKSFLCEFYRLLRLRFVVKF